jgi:hypothetical protein
MGGGFDSLATTFTIITVLGGALALLFLTRALLRYRRGHLVAGTSRLVLATLCVITALLGASLGLNLRTWQRLTHEAPVATLTLQEVRPQYYSALLQFADGSTRMVDLMGDEWQLDARVIKWTGFATVLGFDTLWRAERIAGRYRDLDQERNAERSVHGLAAERGLDLWQVAQRWPWLPWVDTVYGSATYLPMADGAEWSITVSATGLLARPANPAAEAALAAWR